MTKKEMLQDSVSHKERMLKYKMFAVAFSYPDDKFFELFSDLSSEREEIVSEYDSLFRSNEIWLYCAEYLAENEFQRVQVLSDIMGFYNAFGVEPNGDRPDALTCELEFMHYLVFKSIKADTEEKISVCLDAQKKFFNEHLYAPGIKIANSIISKTKNTFYKEIAEELTRFLRDEKEYLATIGRGRV